ASGLLATPCPIQPCAIAAMAGGNTHHRIGSGSGRSSTTTVPRASGASRCGAFSGAVMRRCAPCSTERRMPRYEAFGRRDSQDAIHHVGSVDAPNPDLGLIEARQCFSRRNEADEIWLVEYGA